MSAHFEIKNRYTGSLMYAAETKTLRQTVEQAVKSGADLTDAYLAYANLTRANLTSANLAGADLAYADLARANLTDAYLAYANLTDANLTRANLTRANLTDANLTDADLAYADLTYADLAYADLTRANLAGARLLSSDGAKITLVGNRPYLEIGPIGSRADYLRVFCTDHGIHVRTGCFWGTLAAFQEAVNNTHPSGVHAEEYAMAISMIAVHAMHWLPVAVVESAS